MDLPRCKALILYGRDAGGNRAGLIVPRTCQRVATQGDYCGLHARQAELQDLYREIFGYSWESKVQRYEDRQRRERLEEGREVARGLEKAARELGLNQLASFVSANRYRVAEVWGETAPH
jgi:hypothetical protein